MFHIAMDYYVSVTRGGESIKQRFVSFYKYRDAYIHLTSNVIFLFLCFLLYM